MADSTRDSDIVLYADRKLVSLEASAARIEADFGRIFEQLADRKSLPPLSLPLKSVSPAQTGASTGMKLSPFLKVRTQHNGLDLLSPQGERVLATADGTVTHVAHSVKGSGNVVEITHDSGYVTRYAHLGDISVSRGQRVKRGMRIGTVGMTGNSFAPHLHYEVLRDSVVLDPVNFLFASVSPKTYADMVFMSVSTEQSMD